MEIALSNYEYAVTGDVNDDIIPLVVRDFQEGDHKIVAVGAHGDIGDGADWPVVIVSIAGLFYAGKPLLENFDAWIEIGKRITRFIDRWRQKSTRSYIDEESAIAIALARTSELLREEEQIVMASSLAQGFRLSRGAALAKIEFSRDQTYTVIVSTQRNLQTVVWQSNYVFVIHSDTEIFMIGPKDYIR